MYTVQIMVDIFADNAFPHTFIVLKGLDGVENGYGLGPKEAGSVSGPGNIFDDTYHPYSFATDPIPVTAQQYQDLQDYIDDSVLNPPEYIFPGEWWPGDGHNCTTWATEALDSAGIDSAISDAVYTNPYDQAMAYWVNKWWNDALDWVLRRDPLTLDLDGDGIETLAADGTVLFDHNGDGIKQGTGWVAPDDGLLVLDKNGNGLIDNGNELFGDNTVKADGSLALNGFDALADYDTNGDGRIDAGDAEFANLRIWQDANSDGVSQSGELKTLIAAGVAAINLDSVASTMSVGNDNVANAVGTFERTDGSDGELSAAAASLDLAANPFYREFSDTIAIPEALQSLPDMQGAGAVRDLLQAAASSAILAVTLEQYSNASSREMQMGLLDQLLADWADSADFQDFVERLDGTVVTEVVAGSMWGGSPVPVEIDFKITSDQVLEGESYETIAADGSSYAPTEIFAGGPPLGQNVYGSSALKVGVFDDANIDNLAKVRVLEVFNASPLFDFAFATNLEKDPTDSGMLLDLGLSDTRLYATIVGGRGSSNSVQAVWQTQFAGTTVEPEVMFTDDAFILSEQQQDFVNQSYTSLADSVYSALLFQTRLQPYMDSIGLVIDDQGSFAVDFTEFNALVEQAIANDTFTGLTDYLEFIQHRGASFTAMGWEIDRLKLQGWISDLTAEQAAQLADYGFNINNLDDLVDIASSVNVLIDEAADTTLEGGDKTDVLFAGGGSDTLYGRAGDDLLYGESGNDVVYGGAGSDIATGGAGDDHLYGDAGDDHLDGGDGDDYLSGGGGDDTLLAKDGNDSLYGGAGADELIGGAGNDYLSGDAGNDIYRWGRGDGNDSINDYDSTDRYDDAHQDRLIFGEDIVASDLSWQRSGNHLTFTLLDTGESITVNNYFLADYYKIEGAELFDGTVLDLAQIELDVRTLTGSEAGETLSGFETDDTLLGHGGNDSLYGESGNDELIGGAGNDYLSGDTGNDIYRWGRGDGNDSINDYDSTDRYDDAHQDRLIFGEDIVASDLSWQRSGNHLTFTLLDTGESITVNNYFLADYYKIEGAELFDGTVLDLAQIELDVRTLTGSEAGETLSGFETDDTLLGHGGNDNLYGESGNDELIGGAGNDTLSGDAGNDTYVFGTGFASDIVNNYDSQAGRVDVAKFDDIGVEDLWFSRDGNNLQITVVATEDQVLVSNWFSGDSYQLDSIEVATSILLNSEVEQLVDAMSVYSVPSGAGSVIPENVMDELQPVLADTWSIL